MSSISDPNKKPSPMTMVSLLFFQCGQVGLVQMWLIDELALDVDPANNRDRGIWFHRRIDFSQAVKHISASREASPVLVSNGDLTQKTMSDTPRWNFSQDTPWFKLTTQH